jgi:hypothetical protein
LGIGLQESISFQYLETEKEKSSRVVPRVILLEELGEVDI